MLTCREARSLLSDYLDNDLDADEVAAVDAHLAVCDSCPPLDKATVAVLAVLRRLTPPTGRPEWIDQVLTTVAATQPTRPPEGSPK